jgi:hypothetical protein
LLAVVILLLVLPAPLLFLEWRSARRDLAQAQQTSSEWRRKYEEGDQASRDLAKELQTRARELSLQQEKLAELIRRAADFPPSTSRKAAEFPADPLVFALSVVRSGNSDVSQPVNRITLPPSSDKLVILLLELEPDSDLLSYNGAMSTADGRSIWTRDGLKPNSRNVLALSFKSNLFKPGDYLLSLEGVTSQGDRMAIAKYAFRVLIR